MCRLNTYQHEKHDLVKHFGHSNPSASTCFGFIPARKPSLGYYPTPIQFFKVKDSLHSEHLYGKSCSLKPEKSNIIILPYYFLHYYYNIKQHICQCYNIKNGCFFSSRFLF